MKILSKCLFSVLAGLVAMLPGYAQSSSPTKAQEPSSPTPASSPQDPTQVASTDGAPSSGAGGDPGAPDPAPLPNPAMTGPLQTAVPREVHAGPFGRVAVTGVLSGMGMTQAQWVPGDKETNWDLSNAQLFLQKTTGWWQFYLQGGAYNLPALGTPFSSTPDTAKRYYGPFPQGYLKLVKGNFSIMAGALPKPVVGVNGNGMHTNVSVSENGTNLFWDPKGEEKLSPMGWEFVDRVLTHGNDICLLLNASVNAYRRLDPHFEAPNQLKASPVDRGSMIRIPIGNEKSMRVEVRSVAPDANPYMVMYSIFKTGLDGTTAKIENLRQAQRYLPDNIYTALEDFEKAEWTNTLFGTDVKNRYVDLKRGAADRCPRALGTFVKAPEVQYHHEVYNQLLWNLF